MPLFGVEKQQARLLAGSSTKIERSFRNKKSRPDFYRAGFFIVAERTTLR